MGCGNSSPAAETAPASSGWRTITCPFISSLFKNGTLVLDKDGLLTVDECKQAFVRAGVPEAFMGKIFPEGKFGGKQAKIDIFKMDGTMFEHKTSTGVRDPLPSEGKWKEFAAFAASDGTFGQEEIAKACAHFDKLENSNDINEGGHGSAMSVFPLFLSVFTKFEDGARMSVDDLRKLVLESEFPPGYKPQPRK